MLKLNDLRSAEMFAGLSDEIIKKIEEITSVVSYGEGDYIFKERDHAEYLYLVIEGKIGLEINVHSQLTFLIKCIFPGKAFGISAVVDAEKRATVCHAKALEDAKVFRIKGDDLEALFNLNHEQGYIFMRNVGKVLKNRLEIQRVQLVQGLYNEQLSSV